ncbi:MAG TPA: gliding motility-associated C-terminal domain-containing protein [Salinivirgaceae bacterium]|nr:gliding motility-associated C-terminal domain-containing protein [Salinivirgaceae bacterium]
MRTTSLKILLLLLICSGLNAQAQKFEIKKNPICITDTAEFRYVAQNLTSVKWKYPADATVIDSTANGIGFQRVTFSTPQSKTIIATASVNGSPHTDTLIINVSQLFETYVNRIIEFHSSATYILNMSASINNPLSIAPHWYTWTINGQNTTLPQDVSIHSHKFNNEGVQSVKLNVRDAGGCDVEIDTTVTTVKLFEAPNVFTPNNDGVNDDFIVKSTIPFSIEIYDRSGALVYKPNLTVTQLVWDGRNSAGSVVRPGVYFYVITPEDSNIKPLKGFVHVFHEEK